MLLIIWLFGEKYSIITSVYNKENYIYIEGSNHIQRNFKKNKKKIFLELGLRKSGLNSNDN